MRINDVPAAVQGWRARRCDAAVRGHPARMDWVEHLQWPAMAVTVAAAWLTGAQSKRRRKWGFWLFLASNALWIGWGWHDGAAALIVLQLALAAMNLRGVTKNDAG
jgi:hypothetical protein